MHVLDYIFNRISSIYRFNNYPLYEKTYMIMLYVAGLSLRDLSKRFFGYLKKRTKRFYNNINTWRIQSIEDYAKNNSNNKKPTYNNKNSRRRIT